MPQVLDVLAGGYHRSSLAYLEILDVSSEALLVDFFWTVWRMMTWLILLLLLLSDSLAPLRMNDSVILKFEFEIEMKSLSKESKKKSRMPNTTYNKQTTE